MKKSMIRPPKLQLEELTSRMSVFLEFPEVEERIEAEVNETVETILLSKVTIGGRSSIDVLTDYLSSGGSDEDRLKLIVGLTGGSLERLKRVYKIICPSENWSSIRRDKETIRKVAGFLLNPMDESQVPLFIRRSFQLPANWSNLLQDENYLCAVVRNSLQSKYAVNMGIAFEKRVLSEIEKYEVSHEKGQVNIVDHKEVDVAIPNTRKSRILIMCTYSLTTSSSQSSRANEQALMYNNVQLHNRGQSKRGKLDTIFVNFVDGGGWLDRFNDLRKLHIDCDYCFSYSDMAEFNRVLEYFLEIDVL